MQQPCEGVKALAKNTDIQEIREELLHRLDALRPEQFSYMLFVSAVKIPGTYFNHQFLA